MLSPIVKSILLSYVRTNGQGRPRILSYESILDSITFVLRTGCQWQNVPVKDGSWKTVYHYWSRWSKNHIFERAYEDLVRFYVRRKGRRGKVIVDTSFVKSVYGRDCVGKSPVDRGRMATKVSALVDETGIPLHILFHPGNKSDGRTLEHLLHKTQKRVNLEGHEIYGDKAYGNSRCDIVAARYRLVNRFSRPRQQTDIQTNRTRIVVEHTFGWIDQYRRIILRYDGLVCHFRSFHNLAASNLLAKRIDLS